MAIKLREEPLEMAEKESTFNKGEKRPSPPTGISDERKKKLGGAATYLANKDTKKK